MKPMKKTYLQPQTYLLAVTTDSFIAVSGNFIDGETITETVSDETIDGGNAWSRQLSNAWSEEDDDVN